MVRSGRILARAREPLNPLSRGPRGSSRVLKMAPAFPAGPNCFRRAMVRFLCMLPDRAPAVIAPELLLSKKSDS